MDKPTTLQEALRLGASHFYPLEPCAHGHTDYKRDVKTQRCNRCNSEASARSMAKRLGRALPSEFPTETTATAATTTATTVTTAAGTRTPVRFPVAKVQPPPLDAAPLVLHGEIVARAVGRYSADGDGMALQLDENQHKAVYALTVFEEVMYIGVTQSDLKVRCRYYAKPEKDKAESLTYTNWKIHRLIRAEIEAGREVLLRIVDVPWASFKGLDYWPGVGVEHALIDELCPPWNGESNQATRKMRREARIATQIASDS